MVEEDINVPASKKTSKKNGGKAKPLSVRQEKFVEGVLRHGNKTRAAREAGYSDPNAHASRVAVNGGIQERIQARIQESQIDTREVIGTLVSHMRGSLADVCPKDKFLAEAKKNKVDHLIKEIEINERIVKGEAMGEDGESEDVLERKYKIKIHDSQSAAKHLTTVFGLEKAKETHPNDVERLDKREELRKYLFEQGILQSDAIQ